jgi:hypothetical protein
MMKEGCYITEHEALMANQLAKVMTGGEWSRPAWVDEQYILDLGAKHSCLYAARENPGAHVRDSAA